MKLRKIPILNVFGIILLISAIFLLISFENNGISAVNSSSYNATLLYVDKKYNIIAAGDWYCNEETERTIQNVLNINPDLIITTGDHVKDVKSAACWIEMSKDIKDRMKIAVGNHDAEFKKIYKQIIAYHQLDNPYYSYDFQNVHFISMSTEHPYEEDSKQYEFIKSD